MLLEYYTLPCPAQLSRFRIYRRPCSSRVWLASGVGTLPPSFGAERRLYRSWTVHQCWRSTTTVDLFSFLIFGSFCSSHVSCVRTRTPSLFPPETPMAVRCFLVLFLGFVLLRLYEPFFYNYCCTR